MRQGEVLRTPYLWRHEKTRGRKRCGACLLVRADPLAYLYPITSSMPPPFAGGRGARIYIALPVSETRLLKLPEPSFLILDEVNICREEDLRQSGSLDSLGSLSSAFFENTAQLALAALKATASLPAERNTRTMRGFS